MRRAVCAAHALSLVRDRGALAMSFVLPVLVYLVFAAIFASASGDDLRLSVALADEASTALSRRLAAALEQDAALSIARPAAATAAAAQALVAAGRADVAVVLRREARGLDTLVGDGPAPVLVVVHPTRAVAGSIVSGAVQRAYFAALPDAALRGTVRLVDELVVPLTDAQRAEAATVLDGLTPQPGEAAPSPDADPGAAFATLVETQVLPGEAPAATIAGYYAAAVAGLFILLAGVPVAASLHDDLASGVAERVLAGPGGLPVLVDGRALFLVALGLAQAAVIFAVAWLHAGVRPPATPWPWLAVAAALATASAGVVLATAAACRTARQATTVANIAVLVTAAVGGSMVPRFLMPPWLQQLGWSTPQAWGIDGFAQALGPVPWGAGTWTAVAVLLAMGVAGWLLARGLVRRHDAR